MNPHVNEIFTRFQSAVAEPTTELIYHSSFELLIAVILSAQATDVGVNRATEKLFAVANTPQAILNLGEEGLRQYIKTINLYNNKAKNIIKTCALLIEKFAGEVPCQREELESLPGVGRKTASVILNTAFGELALAVDTHIFRVAQRLDLAAGKTPLAIEQGLLKVVPPQFLKYAHHWLLLHGRYVCKARRPLCEQCVVADLCPSRHLFTAKDIIPGRQS